MHAYKINYAYQIRKIYSCKLYAISVIWIKVLNMHSFRTLRGLKVRAVGWTAPGIVIEIRGRGVNPVFIVLVYFKPDWLLLILFRTLTHIWRHWVCQLPPGPHPVCRCSAGAPMPGQRHPHPPDWESLTRLDNDWCWSLCVWKGKLQMMF